MDTEDLDVLLVSTSDKIVALSSLMRRATASGDPAGFWAARLVLLALRPFFVRFHAAGTGRVPADMSHHLGLIPTRLDHAAHDVIPRCTR